MYCFYNFKKLVLHWTLSSSHIDPFRIRKQSPGLGGKICLHYSFVLLLRTGAGIFNNMHSFKSLTHVNTLCAYKAAETSETKDGEPPNTWSPKAADAEIKIHSLQTPAAKVEPIKRRPAGQGPLATTARQCRLKTERFLSDRINKNCSYWYFCNFFNKH